MLRWHEISANRRSLAYILFSAVVLGAMLMLALLPARREFAEMQKQQKQLKAAIEAQKIFQPLYLRLREKKEQVDGLKASVPQGKAPKRPITVDGAAQALRAAAKSAGMAEALFFPVPASIDQEEDLLLMEGEIRGKYQNFRDFLITLAAWPAFDRIEEIEIQGGTKYPEYRLKIWMRIS